MQVTGNRVLSRTRQGMSPVVAVQALQVTFSGNHCVCDVPVKVHVLIEAEGGATATGNQCLEPAGGQASLVVSGPPRAIAAVANVTSNGVELAPPDPSRDVANITGVSP